MFYSNTVFTFTSYYCYAIVLVTESDNRNSIYSTGIRYSFYVYLFGGLECVGHFFAYVAEPRELPKQAGAPPT
jgi:hypothetical protein